MRPLGIPVVEDKLLQLAVARILGAIYEQDFLPCSYGYRRKRGALDAVHELTVKLQFEPYNFIVEADIEAFFDRLDQDRLIEMLSLRIADKQLLRLIKKWLKAGVLETDGEVTHPVTGSPQGGVISPVLANVYLHYALDLWFQDVVTTHCRGKACLIRYADDFVCGFEREQDAQRFHTALGLRLEKYGLQLAAAKTRIIRFCRNGSIGAVNASAIPGAASPLCFAISKYRGHACAHVAELARGFAMLDAGHGNECFQRARCSKRARRDLCGGGLGNQPSYRASIGQIPRACILPSYFCAGPKERTFRFL